MAGSEGSVVQWEGRSWMRSPGLVCGAGGPSPPGDRALLDDQIVQGQPGHVAGGDVRDLAPRVGVDDLLGIGTRGIAREAHPLGGPQPQQPIAPRRGLPPDFDGADEHPVMVAEHIDPRRREYLDEDEKGNLSRISWERTTPEGWEEAIKRMVRQSQAAIRQRYAGMGMSGSTAENADLQAAAEAGVARQPPAALRGSSG